MDKYLWIKKSGGVAIFAHTHLACSYFEDLSTAIDYELLLYYK